jgi:putative nucleotidyltransferase with HDIG domain
MPTKVKSEKLRIFYRDLCISFVGSLRALSLYPEGHPELEKKTQDLFKRLAKYLSQRPSITLLFVNGEVVVENTPLPELGKTLAQIIQRFESMKLQRMLFRQGLTSKELILLLQILLPLLKNPEDADLILSKNQGQLPHILAGTLPLDTGPQLTDEDLSGILQAAHQSMLSFSEKLKILFTDLEGPLPEDKVLMAKEITETIHGMVLSQEMPLKILIYRRSSNPDPYIHAINVSALSMALARQLGLAEEIIQDVGLCGLLHDIGLHLQSSVPLTHTQTITLDEKKIQWQHPIRGAEILLATPDIPDFVPIVAYEHHLYYDGGGYPKQDRARQLNMASMIICITNSYDNLRRNRWKQKALSLTDALNWMDRQVGVRFHPLLLKQFRALVKAQA